MYYLSFCFLLPRNEKDHTVSSSKPVEHLFDPVHVPGDHLAVRPVIEIITGDEIILPENETLLEVPVAFLSKIHSIGEIPHSPKVLDEDDQEIKMLESVDYGETNINAIIAGSNYGKNREHFGSAGFSLSEYNETSGQADDIVEDAYTNDNYTDDFQDEE